MGLKIIEATPTAISKFIREREQEQPKWCDEDCIIKDRNTEQAIKKAVEAERLRTKDRFDLFLKELYLKQERFPEGSHGFCKAQYGAWAIEDLKNRLEEKEAKK